MSDTMRTSMRLQRELEGLATDPALSSTSRGAARRVNQAMAAFMDTLRPGYGDNVSPRPSSARDALHRVLPLPNRLGSIPAKQNRGEVALLLQPTQTKDWGMAQLPTGDRDDGPRAA